MVQAVAGRNGSIQHALVVLLLLASVVGVNLTGRVAGHVVVSETHGFVIPSPWPQNLDRAGPSDPARRLVSSPDPTPLPTPVAPPPFGLSVPLTHWVVTTVFGNGHWAVDLGAPCGDPVASADNGMVEWAGWGDNGGGIQIEIDHGWAVTWYDHLSIVAVMVGDEVVRGQLIGYVGSTGNSFGCHLHWAAAVGQLWVDPMTLLVPVTGAQ